MFAAQILVSFLALAVQNSEPKVDPLSAFGQVCIDGEATFAPGAIVPIKAAKIPRRARQAAMLVIWLEEYDYANNRVVWSEDMSESAFELNSRSACFLTPPSQSPTNPVQESCVLWAQNLDFADVSRFLAEKSGRNVVEVKDDTAAISYNMGDYRLKAGRIFDWTIISASPDDATALTETTE